MAAVDPEDIAALRAESPDDLIEYLLSLGGRARTKTATPELAADERAARRPITSPLHRPGAWPAGIQAPTGSATCHPDCDCAPTPKPPNSRKDQP
jgi:hypothetical protein